MKLLYQKLQEHNFLFLIYWTQFLFSYIVMYPSFKSEVIFGRTLVELFLLMQTHKIWITEQLWKFELKCGFELGHTEFNHFELLLAL